MNHGQEVECSLCMLNLKRLINVSAEELVELAAHQNHIPGHDLSIAGISEKLYTSTCPCPAEAWLD